MDVVRAPRKKTGRNIAIVGGVIAVVAVTVALSKIKPASPTVDDGTLYKDSVRRGDMVREVRGPGNLVPEHIRWITAQASARVERLVAVSGQSVTPDMVLLEMSNPDLQIQTMQAEQQARQAQIDLLNLRTNLQNNRLSQEGAVASMKTAHLNATQEAQAADSLLKMRLIAPFEANSKKALAIELTTRLKIEQDRLALMNQAVDSQIAGQTAQVVQLKAIAANQQAKLASLKVRAPDAGVLQDLNLQPGQWVPDGTTLAKVVQPGALKAVLRIPETQAKDVQIGQSAMVDTRNGLIPGHVKRKDPSSQNGTVTVDIELDGPLPAGAVPDLSIDGTIQIEKLKSVMFVGRPAYGAGTGTVRLFKIVENGSAAIAMQVVLGRSSVNTVEVIRGLNVGDKVILSDMGQWDSNDRVRLKK